MKRAIIGGAAYGWHNIGDDGLLRGIFKDLNGIECGVITRKSEWLEKEYPHIKQFEIDNLYHKPNTGCWYGLRSNINDWKKSLFPDMTPYNWSDVLICGGGTIFSACPWHAYRLSMLENKMKKPTIIWGAGMCTETDLDKINLIKKWCNADNVLHVYVRDEMVEKRLLDIGVQPKKISVCYDPAYVLDIIPFDPAILNDKANDMYYSNNPKMVLTLSGESDIRKKVNLDVFKTFIKKEISRGFEIFLIPISYSDHNKDMEFALELEKLYDKHITYVKTEFHPQQLIDFLTNIDISISSRLHMSIYSAIAGIPFISLLRNDKNSDLAKLFNLPCLSFDNLKSEILVESVNRLLSDTEIIKSNIVNQVSNYKDIHELKAKEMRTIISNL